jgi:acetylornithine deacetylase
MNKSQPPTLMDMFSQLVVTPSVSSVNPRFDQSNKGVIELLANWLSDLEFTIELMPVAERPEKLNLIATLGEGDGGLVLSGHTDTVPYDDGAWTYDPFELTEVEDRFYGLGASDMKCFFPLVIEALRDFKSNQLMVPVIVLATADEESSMDGARALLSKKKRLGRFALIGEPTGLKPIYMHKGVVMEAIKLHGRSGHSSNPALGNSALEGMHKVISRLLEWRERLQARYQDQAFEVPVPTLNLGCVHGGDSPNRICAYCELQVDLRLLPDMDVHSVRTELRRLAEQAVANSGLRVELAPLFKGVAAFGADRTWEIVQVAERLTDCRPGTVAFATEAPFLRALGMQTVILGPGDIACAHQPDEFVTGERLQAMLLLLRRLIAHFCLGKGTHGGS